MRRTLRGFAVLGLVASLFSTLFPMLLPSAWAATFGVPTTPGQADGWFMLIGKDAVDEGRATFFGDITRELRLNIEVTGRDLELCIFDPGTFDPNLDPATQLDFEFVAGASRSTTRYELFEPGNPVAIKTDDTTWGPDTVASDNAFWCFYDTTGPGADPRLVPGTYQLVVTMVDGPGLDQHANVFGVETTPDYNSYVYYATAGHSVMSGAGLINDQVLLYPWAVTASAKDGPICTSLDCGLDIYTYDLNAPVDDAFPPTGEIVTRLNFSEMFNVAIDARTKPFAMCNMMGLNAGDDHGIYSITFSEITGAAGVLETNLVPPLPAPLDFNAFSFQLYETGEIDPSLFYPIFPPDPRMNIYKSRRIYLPRKNGAPAKEYLQQVIANPPVGRDYVDGQLGVQVDIEVRIVNPTGYDLTNIVGQTTVSPSGQLTDPTNVLPVANTTVNGRTIDFNFPIVAAGGFETVTYTVNYDPILAAPPLFFLTGDSTNAAGGANPTTMTWDTPFATAEVASACGIQTRVVAAPCSVGAVPTAPIEACLNESIRLDGSTSTRVSCTLLEYMWSGPGIAAPAWSLDPFVNVLTATPGGNDFTLEVRCQGDPSCTDTQMITVTIFDAERPVADAGGDVTVGSCDLPIALGSPAQPLVDYTWTSTFPILQLLDADNVAEPNFIETAPGVYDLVLDAVSQSAAGCNAQAAITVTVTAGDPLGSLGNSLRAIESTNHLDVELSWALGLIVPDRFNVHRVNDKTLFDKSTLPGPYATSIYNVSEILVSTFVDAGVVPDLTDVLYAYEVYGRNCAGTSAIQ